MLVQESPDSWRQQDYQQTLSIKDTNFKHDNLYHFPTSVLLANHPYFVYCCASLNSIGESIPPLLNAILYHVYREIIWSDINEFNFFYLCTCIKIL